MQNANTTFVIAMNGPKIVSLSAQVSIMYLTVREPFMAVTIVFDCAIQCKAFLIT